jgi:hypothetical protein
MKNFLMQVISSAAASKEMQYNYALQKTKPKTNPKDQPDIQVDRTPVHPEIIPEPVQPEPVKPEPISPPPAEPVVEPPKPVQV